MTVFIICGLFSELLITLARLFYIQILYLSSDLLLSTLHVFFEGYSLSAVPTVENHERRLVSSIFVLYISQSITVPLQGFLNAIVYGWTREEFVLAVRSPSVNAQNQNDKLFKEQGSVSYEAGLLSSTTEGEDSIRPRSVAAPRDFLYSIPE